MRKIKPHLLKNFDLVIIKSREGSVDNYYFGMVYRMKQNSNQLILWAKFSFSLGYKGWCVGEPTYFKLDLLEKNGAVYLMGKAGKKNKQMCISGPRKLKVKKLRR